MKTINELQQEVRYIRKDIEKMDKRLAVLDEELSLFKDSLQNEDSIFTKIYHIAEGMPRIAHPITRLGMADKSIYMGALIMVATLEDSINDSQLLFLQRMIMADSARTQLDSYMGTMDKITPENIMFKLSEEVKNTYGNELLLDMLIIANLSKVCTRKSYITIADIAALMNKNKVNVFQMCAIAVAVLKQNAIEIKGEFGDILDYNRKYAYYLKEVKNWDKVVEKAKKEKEEYDHRNISRFHNTNPDAYQYFYPRY